MSEIKKCIRCQKTIRTNDFCQNCKNELLPYFEQTNDWYLAYDMEYAHEKWPVIKQTMSITIPIFENRE